MQTPRCLDLKARLALPALTRLCPAPKVRKDRLAPLVLTPPFLAPKVRKAPPAQQAPTRLCPGRKARLVLTPLCQVRKDRLALTELLARKDRQALLLFQLTVVTQAAWELMG